MFLFKSFRFVSALTGKFALPTPIRLNLDKQFLQASSPLTINKLSFHREISDRLGSKMRSLDNVPDSYSLIYIAPLKKYIKITYYGAFFSAISVSPLLGAALYINQFPLIIAGIEMINSTLELCGISLALLFAIANAGIVVLKYPLRIYKHKDNRKYIAMYQHLLPWKCTQEEFLKGEIKKTEKGIMPWKHCLYEFRKRKAIIMDHHFYRPIDFDEMFSSPEEAYGECITKK